MIGAIGPGGPGDQFRLGPRQDTKPGLIEPQPDHRRGGLLQRLRPAGCQLQPATGSISSRSHPSPGDVFAAAEGPGADPEVRTARAAGGHRDRRQRFAGLCLSDHQPGRHGHGSDLPATVDSRIKAAFAQFLWLRHGGSGYLFGFGNGAVGQNCAVVPPIDPPISVPADYGSGIPAERPFRSLSFPDIDYTVMRPATLPPSLYTNPQKSTDATPSKYTDDPGVRNPNLYPGYRTQNAPTGSVAASGTMLPVYPGAIPVRRLFQVPDADPESNASESGDRFINNQEPAPPPDLVPNSPPVLVPAPVRCRRSRRRWSSMGRRCRSRSTTVIRTTIIRTCGAFIRTWSGPSGRATISRQT